MPKRTTFFCWFNILLEASTLKIIASAIEKVLLLRGAFSAYKTRGDVVNKPALNSVECQTPGSSPPNELQLPQ